MDRSLNHVGEMQAAQSARHLASFGAWRRVVTSPLTRARQTAAAIAAETDLPVEQPLIDLVEQSFGAAEGVGHAQAKARWPDGAYPGRESTSSIEERVARAWAEITSQPGDAIVVAHIGIVRAILQLVTGHAPDVVENGSVTVLSATSGGWSVSDRWAPSPCREEKRNEDPELADNCA